MSGSERSAPHISAPRANYWWRQNTPAGALLNKLLLLFIFVPMALVFKNLYTLSILVFALMIPYGLLVQRLAVRAVREHLEKHPEEQEQFQQAGIISC